MIKFCVLKEVEDEVEKQNEEDVENFLNNEGVGELDDDEDNEEEEAERELQYEETNFVFDDFVRRFANVKVVRAMAILLQNFDENSLELNRCILKLLHRIAWDCKMSGMIFQASIFRIFQRILESKHPEHKELQKFAVFIIRRFEEVAEKNRKAYMELLFWKNTREANEMVDGYDVQVENKKVSRAVWSEAEEDELRTLFMEHQTNKYTQDLIDWLLENIISDNRTRRGIIKKLKEMHLIVNSKHIKNEIQKRLPKEWGEDEIAQLTELWERVKDDDYPIDFIYGGLRIKRPIPKIKEKLLELGLAKDKKELRKKRKKKNDDSNKASHDESSDGNSSSDDDSEIMENNSQLPIAKKKLSQKSNNKKSKKQPVIVYTDAQLAGLLKNVLDNNMKESLEWIRESLEEALEDRDEESIEGIPLVPITDYSSAAMDSPSFQRLLRAIGIEPPANEQEAYWRIPSIMLSATIRKRCNLITSILNGNYIDEEPIIVEKRNLDSDVDDIDQQSDNEGTQPDLEKIKKMFREEEVKSPARQSLTEILDSSSDNDVNEVAKVKIDKKQSVSRKKKNAATEMKISDGLKLNSSRIKINDDSSDSDIEIQINHDNAESKRNRSDDSDAETPTLKKRRVIDSDEENDNDSVSRVVESKQARTVVSDDED
ncbi:hypothetical protein PV327_007889 [Microctonus hyperodae]|uniref:Timeless C-terminal domain-containing protein n=1 Tax=Microctonus hyperodae TaxID=165561 RepID=A0AA39KZ29_MICHY|nr:hypothetical protein PV327_007889 [Microctonus hyperodae]